MDDSSPALVSFARPRGAAGAPGLALAGGARRAARTTSLLPREPAERIAAVGRAQGATLFDTLLAAFNVLLYRCCGETDLAVGCPAANGTPGAMSAIRTSVSGGASFSEVVRRTRTAALKAHEGSHPNERAGDGPRLNVRFARRAELDGEPPLGAGVDLAFGFAETPAGVVCAIDCDGRTFDANWAERLLSNFAQLVESIGAAPEAPVAHAVMLAAGERATLLTGWNREPAPDPDERPVREHFEARAAQTPDAPALRDETAALTYGELNARANQVAHALRAAGLRREEFVAIAADRSVWTIVSMLAVLKAGGAYLPLDPTYPGEQLAAMVAETGVRIMLARGGARAPAATAIRIDVDADAGEGRAVGNPPRGGGAGDVAYVMFTSGSTGRAKGVLATNRAIANLVFATPALRIEPGDAVAQFSSIAFDGATYEIWGALLNGARLEIMARETMLDPVALSAALRERRISVAFLTSALLRHVVRVEPAAFATLRCLMAGGEVLDPAAIRAVLAHGAPRRLFNVYGPSETTTFATAFEIVEPPATAIPIGTPLVNVQAYILDGDGNAVPIGAAGQLHIGGLGVARGYLNDPDRTARAFIRHPFSSDPDARVYATGDRARFLPDGNIEFLGRTDRQVKLRGFRIETDEIETALKALPGVADAVVALREVDGEGRLVAFIADAAEPPRGVAHWRAGLAPALPAYMLPEIVVPVASIPLTVNGKTDAGALDAALAALRAENAARRPEPDRARGSDTRHAVARIFADVLGIARAAEDDDFFALGGHSLLAAQAIARIGDRLGVEISLRDFFADPTPAGIAARVADRRPRSVRPVRAAPDADVGGLSDEQVDALLAQARRE